MEMKPSDPPEAKVLCLRAGCERGNHLVQRDEGGMCVRAKGERKDGGRDVHRMICQGIDGVYAVHTVDRLPMRSEGVFLALRGRIRIKVFHRDPPLDTSTCPAFLISLDENGADAPLPSAIHAIARVRNLSADSRCCSGLST